jgi:hypothetical protein
MKILRNFPNGIFRRNFWEFFAEKKNQQFTHFKFSFVVFFSLLRSLFFALGQTMSIVAGANILVTLNTSCPTSDELDAEQALSSIAVLDTISDLESDDETFGFDNTKRVKMAQENVFRYISAKYIANVVRKSRVSTVVKPSSRKSSRKRSKATTTDESR